MNTEIFPPSPAQLRDWAAHPAASGTVPVHPNTLRSLAAVLEAGQLEPAHGDQLPPLGSRIEIHLGRSDAWVPVTVIGYYAWPPLHSTSPRSLHRVFVRVRDDAGYENARMLADTRPCPTPTPTQGENPVTLNDSDKAEPSPHAGFGTALVWLRSGARVQRAGWNGPGQWVVRVTSWNAALGVALPPDYEFAAFLALKNAQSQVVPWLPSQGDVEAQDWQLVQED